MFGSSILEVAIGMVFIYLFLGVLCTTINETLAAWKNKRGTTLLEGVKSMLSDPQFGALARSLYEHGMVGGISQKNKGQKNTDGGKDDRLPSYIPAGNFSLALLDILASSGLAATRREELSSTLSALDYQLAQKTQAAAGNPTAQAELQQLQQKVAAAEKTLRDEAKTVMQNYTNIKQQLAGHPQDANLLAQYADARQIAIAWDSTLKMVDERRALLANGDTVGKSIEQMQTLVSSSEKYLQLASRAKQNCGQVIDHVELAIARMPDSHTKDSLRVLLEKTRREVKAGEDAIEAMRKNVETWFNQSMDRVSGWYKRWSQYSLLVIATVLVVCSNADSLDLANRLMHDSSLRAALVNAAVNVVNDPNMAQAAKAATVANAANTANTATAAATGSSSPPTGQSSVPASATSTATTALANGSDSAVQDSKQLSHEQRDKILGEARKLNLPLGWDAWLERLQQASGWAMLGLLLMKIFGLAISVFATSLGAPFWFDLLVKIVNLRSSGSRPAKA